MKAVKLIIGSVLAAGLSMASVPSFAQEQEAPTVLTLEDALRIALSENASVKVADMEIERTGYARKGTYSSLWPQIDASGSFQKTIKRQVMYMDFDMGDMFGGGSGEEGGFEIPGMEGLGGGNTEEKGSSNDGFEVGRLNTFSYGVSAGMPLINAQLWQSLKISDIDVEVAVEKARNSRLEVVNQVKQAYYACLLANDVFNVYKSVYDNAVEKLEQTQKKYNVQRASELDLVRAKTSVANAIPNVYDAESSAILALWRLKAVMGVDLEENLAVSGTLEDYYNIQPGQFGDGSELSLENNSSLRQLALQAEQLAEAVKLQKYSTLPSLSLSFAYTVNAMQNDFHFSNYKWSPYSFVGLNLSIPIFAGGKRASAIKQSRIQADELEVNKANAERQLKISIRQYLNSMETAMKTYTSAQSACESAQKAYDISAQSYNVGRSTLTDLNDAQLALTQSKLGINQAVYSYLVAQANLENTLGADFTEE